MALYVVLHHRLDPVQPWANAWLDDERIDAIQTTLAIARAAEAAGGVFVHRCAWGSKPAQIVCEARVLSVQVIDRSSALVRFAPTRTMSAPPPITVSRGQSSYNAPAPG